MDSRGGSQRSSSNMCVCGLRLFTAHTFSSGKWNNFRARIEDFWAVEYYYYVDGSIEELRGKINRIRNIIWSDDNNNKQIVSNSLKSSSIRKFMRSIACFDYTFIFTHNTRVESWILFQFLFVFLIKHQKNLPSDISYAHSDTWVSVNWKMFFYFIWQGKTLFPQPRATAVFHPRKNATES